MVFAIQRRSADRRDWLRAVDFFLNRWRRVPLKKASIFALDALRNRAAMLVLLRARRGSNLRALVAAYPEIFFMASGPYLAKSWNGTQRISRIIDHCRTVEGGILDLPPGGSLNLCELACIDRRYRLIVHQPREYIWEGLLDLSLCCDERIIFSLRFSLSSDENRRIAYIGSLQGRHHKYEPSILSIYKHFSLNAERIRPRDFIIEAFQSLCAGLNISTILAIADDNKPRRDYERSYDDDWKSHGGINEGNGFFSIPVEPRRRSSADIASKKRAMYRRRYALLSLVRAQIADRITETGSDAL